MKALAIIAGAAYLSGCAAMIPNTVTPEFVHESHASQHRPFAETPTNYGAELLDVSLGWHLGDHVRLELAEGISLDKRSGTVPYEAYGEIAGPREQFIGRIGYQFKVKQ
jgi:hypothetical protein